MEKETKNLVRLIITAFLCLILGIALGNAESVGQINDLKKENAELRNDYYQLSKEIKICYLKE